MTIAFAVACLAAVAVAWGESAPASPGPSPNRSASPAARGRLNLGLWGSPYADGAPGGAPLLPDSPRFRDEIDVESTPMDLNTAMAWWWKRYNFEYSIYRGTEGKKPGLDILPALTSLGRKIKDRNREVPLPEGPSPEPRP